MSKRLIFSIVLLFCFVFSGFAEDRIRVQVQFKQAVWTCPVCGQEDIEDRPMSGGASYEHTCSKCSAKFNQSGSNMREYNGSINLTPQEYETTDSKELADLKKEKVDAFIYDYKNPPAYVEPTAEQIQAEIDAKTLEVQTLTAQKTAIVAKATLEKEIVK